MPGGLVDSTLRTIIARFRGQYKTTAAYRILKRPFLRPELYCRTRRDVNSHFWLMKKPTLCQAARPGGDREARETSFIQLLARIQSERRRRLALASGFRLSDYLE